MSRHVICPAAEIGVGQARRVSVENRDIAIFNVNGEFAAIGDRCPHQGASLCHGTIIGLAQSEEPGVTTMMREGEFVRCPWHGWEFDIKTGKSWCDPARTRVKSFAVSVEGGAAVLEAAATRVEGPYAIDVYEVTLEDNYVVLTI